MAFGKLLCLELLVEAISACCRAHLHEAPEQAVVALHNAGLLSDDVQHEDPFVLFSGAGLLYQYWVELRRKGDTS